MKQLIFVIVLLFSIVMRGQQLSFSPEVMVGNRSYFYTHTHTHTVSYQVNDKWKLSNLILFDTEYTEDTHNILFIRNTVSYKISDRFSLHNGFGVKNPGAFFLSYLQYQYKNKQNTLNISYSAGATYQAGFTLEQSFLIECTPKLTQKLNAFFRLSAVGNTDFNEYTRGFQHIRIGLKDEKLMYGLAFNAEQFNISWDHLENLGVFVKYNF